jgi:hypothetical protein
MAFDQRLRDQHISYWLTDSKGQPVTIYDYKSDISISEWLFSSYWPNTSSREKPRPVRRTFTLKRGTSDVIVHLIYSDGHEDSIDLRKATLEPHKYWDVLYVK